MPALAADLIVGLHAGFIVLALLGAALLLRWPRLVWLHLPALAWGSWIELSGGICPLTPLENRLRAAAGDQGYQGGFIDHYITPLIYPAGLGRGTQLVFGGLLIGINALLYLRFWRARQRR